MEIILSYIKSYTEPYLSFSSTFLVIDRNVTLLGGLGLLLLYLCYLELASFVQSLRENKYIHKCQGRAKRRRKGGTSHGERTCQREAEEGKRLRSILKSPLGQHHDANSFRQLLCPDPLCEVCNRSTAEISHLLYKESLEDATLCVTPLASIGSVTESSFYLTSTRSASPPVDLLSSPLPEPFLPPCSNLSPNPTTPFVDSLSPLPLDDSLQPEPVSLLDSTFPVDHFPPQSLAFPPLLVHHTLREDFVLQPEATLSLVDGPRGLSTYVPAIRDLDCSSMAISEFSWWQAHDKNLFPYNSAQCDIEQEFLAFHSSQSFFQGEPVHNLVEPDILSFLSSDVRALLERQVKKKGDFLMWKVKKKKTGSDPKQLKQDYQLNFSGKMSESVADKHDVAVSLPFWSSKCKPEELHVYQKTPHPKDFEDHLQQKCTQLFWGLPTLHSESLHSTISVSGDYSSNIVFNVISNTSIAQESSVLYHSQPLSRPEVQHQSLHLTLSQDKLKHLTQAQYQAHLQSPVPVLCPSSLSQIRICRICFQRPQNEAWSLSPSEIDHLEWNMLKKKQEHVWGLPSVVQRSQKDFCPPAPNPPLASQSSKAHVPVSILLGDFPLNSEFRKKLEHHLRKRLIQHRWGLPQRVSDSLKMMAPQTETLETPESKSSYGLSWIPFYKNHSKEPNNFGVNKPGSFRRKSSEILLLGKPMGKDQEQSTEDGPNDYSLSDSERLSGCNLVSDSEKDLESCTVSLSQNNSRASGMKLKYSVKEKVPLSEKSHRQMNYIDLAPLVKGDYCLNTSKKISFISPSKQKILEAHLKSFHKRIMTGLPPRVVQSMQIFNKREDSSQTFCHSNIFSSDISGVDSKYRVSKPLQGNSNSFHRDNVETNAAPVLYHPLPAILTVEKEGQEALRQPPSDIHHGLTQDVERLHDCRWLPLPHTHSITDNASQKLTVLANRCSSEMLTGQAGTDPEPRDKRESSTSKVERPQDKRSTNLKHFYMSNISRETVKAKKLCALDSQPSITLATSEPKIFPVKTVNMNKVETTLNTESPSLISVLQDPRSPVLKNHQLVGLKVKLENKEHNQTLSMPQKEACAMEASPAGVM